MNTKGGVVVNFILILFITAIIFLGVMYLATGRIPFGISRPLAQPKEVVEESVEPDVDAEMEELAEAIDENLEEGDAIMEEEGATEEEGDAMEGAAAESGLE